MAALVFVIGVALTALTFVLDQALIGLLRGGLQLNRNIVFSVVKLAALIPVAALVADAGPQWIYGTWTAGIAVSMVVLIRFYRSREGDSLGPDFRLLREMRVQAVTHHAVNLALRTPELALPVVVVTFLSASANASFYIAYMITSFMFFVPLSLSTVLYAVGSGESKRLADRFRLTVYVSLGFGLASNLALLVLGTPLLEIFGRELCERSKRHAPHPRPRHLPLDGDDALRRAPPDRAAACDGASGDLGRGPAPGRRRPARGPAGRPLRRGDRLGRRRHGRGDRDGAGGAAGARSEHIVAVEDAELRRTRRGRSPPSRRRSSSDSRRSARSAGSASAARGESRDDVAASECRRG